MKGNTGNQRFIKVSVANENNNNSSYFFHKEENISESHTKEGGGINVFWEILK